MNASWALPVASIIVAIVGAFGAYAAQKAASKASQSSSRMDSERDAYERARAFDTETIRRQDIEIEELRNEVQHLRVQNNDLIQRVFILEHPGIQIITPKELTNDRNEPGPGPQPEPDQQPPV